MLVALRARSSEEFAPSREECACSKASTLTSLHSESYDPFGVAEDDDTPPSQAQLLSFCVSMLPLLATAGPPHRAFGDAAPGALALSSPSKLFLHAVKTGVETEDEEEDPEGLSSTMECII